MLTGTVIKGSSKGLKMGGNPPSKARKREGAKMPAKSNSPY